MILVLIILLASSSYIIGTTAVVRGNYKPSIYSRFIWFLLAANSFAGVVALHNAINTLVLSGISLVGAFAMLAASWRYSVRKFGTVEKICTALLLASGVLWLTVHAPLINVILGLTAHLIGAIPSFIKAVRVPKSENLLFWLSFAIASILALITAEKSNLGGFIYALYFTLFDSGMTILSLRQYRKSS